MTMRARRQFWLALLCGVVASLCVVSLAVAETTAGEMVDAAARAEKLGIVGFLSLVLIACITGLIWLIHMVISDLRALVVEAKVSLDHAASAIVELKGITVRCAMLSDLHEESKRGGGQ